MVERDSRLRFFLSTAICRISSKTADGFFKTPLDANLGNYILLEAVFRAGNDFLRKK